MGHLGISQNGIPSALLTGRGKCHGLNTNEGWNQNPESRIWGPGLVKFSVVGGLQSTRSWPPHPNTKPTVAEGSVAAATGHMSSRPGSTALQ